MVNYDDFISSFFAFISSFTINFIVCWIVKYCYEKLLCKYGPNWIVRILHYGLVFKKAIVKNNLLSHLLLQIPRLVLFLPFTSRIPFLQRPGFSTAIKNLDLKNLKTLATLTPGFPSGFVFCAGIKIFMILFDFFYCISSFQRVPILIYGLLQMIISYYVYYQYALVNLNHNWLQMIATIPFSYLYYILILSPEKQFKIKNLSFDRASLISTALMSAFKQIDFLPNIYKKIALKLIRTYYNL